MKQISLTAELRTERGKSAARKLRRAGLLPAILYGRKSEPISLSLAPLELKGAISTEAGESALIELCIKAGKKTEKKTVILKELQVHPVKRNYLHADLYEIEMDVEIVVPVAIRLIGKAKGVESGGILQQVKREVDVRCLPSDIPEHIDIDVTDLEIGDSVHLNEIKMKEGIEIVEDLDLGIASVLAPSVVEEVEKEVEEEEGEEAVVEEDKEE